MPDVAYNAAVLHGVLTYLDIPGVPVGYYRFGGTSAGSPQWAAITAIASQKAAERAGIPQLEAVYTDRQDQHRLSGLIPRRHDRHQLGG